MPRERVIITDFSAGEMSERLAGRVELKASRSAAAELRGMIVRPDGGVTRRPQTVFVHDEAGISPHEDGLLAERSTPGICFYTNIVGMDEDEPKREPCLVFIDEADNALRRVNLSDWDVSDVVTELEPGTPLHTTGAFAKADDVAERYVQIWNHSGSELIDLQEDTASPREGKEIGVVYENRLITADRNFGKLYFSVPLELLNNDLEETKTVKDPDGKEEEVTVDTGAIEIRPDFFGAESVRWIAARGSVYLGTDQGEYEVTSGYAAFTNDPGGVVILPIGDAASEVAEYFGESLVLTKDRRLVRMQQAGSEGAYQSMSMMELQDNAEVQQLASIDLGSHRYLFALDVQNTLWGYVEAPESEVAAWSRVAEDIWAIAGYDQDLYIVREHEGSFNIEALCIDNIRLGANRTRLHQRAHARNYHYIDQGCYVYLGEDEDDFIQDKAPANTDMRCYVYTAADGYSDAGSKTTDDDGWLFADYSDARDFIDVSEPTRAIVYGYPAEAESFESYLRTFPIEIATQEGPALSEPTRINRIVVVVEETQAMEVRVAGGKWQAWESEQPYSGPVSFTLHSGNRERTYVEVRSVDRYPLTVMSIQADVQKGSL